jgi:putative endopeptidase
MRKIFLFLTICIITFSCKESTEKQIAFDFTGMDTTINPADDFFSYANGQWIKNSKIPEDQTGWGSFYTLYEENLVKLKSILDETAYSKNSKGSDKQKVGDFYKSGMDTVAIEKLGYEPLKPMFEKIEAINDYNDLLNVIVENAHKGLGGLLGFYVGSDEKNSNKNIPILYQTGLSLPDQAYYFKTDSITKTQQKEFLKHASNYFQLIGISVVEADKMAYEIFNLETDLAKSHLTRVELRDPVKNYNKMAVSDLEKLTPNIQWANLFKKMGFTTDSLNVSQPKYFTALNNLLTTKPIQLWKHKLKYDYISNTATYLSKKFRDERFNFSRIFSGQKVQEERWKFMVNATDNGLGELLGKLFVQKHFPEEAKKKMDELVNNLQVAFKNRIQKLDWMSDSTKSKALEKLNAIVKKIGYPEKWKSYDDVDIDANSFFKNNESIGSHEWNEMIEKVGKPVDKTEWGMSTPTVNAYFNPSYNEIVFPAGILQFPFFNKDADDAINYGAIGMVIGHEMTHGFDDQGRQYDANGNLQDWWKQQDAEKFTSKAKNVINQYNAFTVLDSVHVNGELTLGENLADIGGIAIAYDAFQLTKQAKENVKLDGFTPNQRFFLGYAQVWRIVNRDETMRTRIAVDPHSPEKFRINGPLSNFTAFYEAFNVKEGNKLYLKPTERVVIW